MYVNYFMGNILTCDDKLLLAARCSFAVSLARASWRSSLRTTLNTSSHYCPGTVHKCRIILYLLQFCLANRALAFSVRLGVRFFVASHSDFLGVAACHDMPLPSHLSESVSIGRKFLPIFSI